MTSLFVYLWCALLTILRLSNSRVLNEIGRLYIEDVDIGASEIISIDTKNNRIYSTNSYSSSIDVIDFNINKKLTKANLSLKKRIFIPNLMQEKVNNKIINITINDVTSVK